MKKVFCLLLLATFIAAGCSTMGSGKGSSMTSSATVEVAGTDHTMRAYPSLIDEGTSVGIRLLATAAEQETEMWRGTVRLLLLNLPSPGKLLRPLLDRDAKSGLRAGPHADQTEWVEIERVTNG